MGRGELSGATDHGEIGVAVEAGLIEAYAEVRDVDATRSAPQSGPSATVRFAWMRLCASVTPAIASTSPFTSSCLPSWASS